jgi:hypothetical protein
VSFVGRSGWAARGSRGKPIQFLGQSYSLSSLSLLPIHAVSEHVKALNEAARQTCLADTSLASYISGWSAWIRCATFYGFPATCMSTANNPLTLEVCADFIDLFIGFECGLRQMNPTSITNVYLPGIAKTFDIMRLFNNFRAAANHKVTQCVVDGYARAWAKKHPAHMRTKIPFTIVLALQTDSFLDSGAIPTPGLPMVCDPSRALFARVRITCALCFGIFFLLRKGEFLQKPMSLNCHHIPMQKSHLRFLTKEQHEIPFPMVGTVRATWLTITVVFSKTDQTGRGRIVTHHVDSECPEHCIVQRMEAYIAVARDRFSAIASDLLFDIPTFPPLTTESLATVMRSTCRLVGLPDDRVSAHSLRYGGATTLAAAGFPEYIIAFYGGWAPGSTAMRRYIKPSNDVVRRVSQHMSRAHSAQAVHVAVNQLLMHNVPAVMR